MFDSEGVVEAVKAIFAINMLPLRGKNQTSEQLWLGEQ